MQELQCVGDVPGDQRCLLLRETHATLDVVQQRASSHLLEHHVEAIVILEPLKI